MTINCLQAHVLNVYTVKIAVRGISPMIWRLLRISESASLAQFHHVIQIAIGWDDDHLHKFRIYEKTMASITQVVHFIPMTRTMCALMRSNSNREVSLSTHTTISTISSITFVGNPWFTSTSQTRSPDCIGGNPLTDRDLWSPLELPFDCVDSVEDLTVSELIERLTFIAEQCKPPVFCRQAVNRRLVDAWLQSA